MPIQHPFNILIELSLVTAITYISMCIFLFFYQTRFLFFPSPHIETTPSSFYIYYEEVWLPIKVGKSKFEYVHGWWIPTRRPKSKVMLYLHGNALNMGANINRANHFHQLGFSVLLIDYRGYGQSQGSFPNETKIYEDAAAAWNYLIQQKSVPPNQIVIYGHSLGGGVAIDLGSKHHNAAGLIVESSFTSIRDVITHRSDFSMFPVKLILTQRFASITKVSRLQIPTLFIHGTADVTIPYFMSQKLYNAVTKPKELLLISGAGHNDVADVAPFQYTKAVNSFSEKVFR